MKKELSKEERKEKVIKIVSAIVFASFILPIGFLIVKIAFPDFLVTTMTRTRSDYVLMLFQCLLGVLVLFFPNMISKKKGIRIQSNLY